MAKRHDATARRAPEPEMPAGAGGSSAGPAPLGFTPLVHTVGHSAGDVNLLSAAMGGLGLDFKSFEDAAGLTRGWSRRVPDVVVIDVATNGVDAIDAVFMLAERKYNGTVQFTAETGTATIEGVMRAAERHGLRILPPIARPFDNEQIKTVLQEQKTAALQSGPSKIKLEEALKHNWIDFWYQPKINLRNKSLIGVESFVRLFHPQIGSVPPSVFLADAEDASLFILGQRALVHAVKTASHFAEMGLNLSVSINVSVKALRTLPVARIIQSNHLNTSMPLKLTFDVTEADVAADPSFISQRVKLLRTLGVSLAIDDFKSDRLSQTDLKNMTPAELKIPRLFVAGCEGKTVEAMICQSIIDAAHKLQAQAVAIGIERPGQVTALDQMGCDVGQGFLFGQPMASEEIVRLMRQRTAPGKA
jgi:EAL domain-containing protein (putative c-di-GMP-specific phosphodiesterase class I)